MPSIIGIYSVRENRLGCWGSSSCYMTRLRSQAYEIAGHRKQRKQKHALFIPNHG